jgi:hypothetical protein
MSASDTGDFLRLARSWLRSMAVSGVTFSESVAAGAKFCFSGREFRLSLLPISTLYPKLQSLSNAWLSYPTQYATALGNRLWKWYVTALSTPCLQLSTPFMEVVGNRFIQPG